MSTQLLLSDAARSWEGSAAKGGSPHERLPWFPPLALCIKKGIKIIIEIIGIDML
ncbi:hypothetical protein [Moorena sp. SIO4G3]|uniref:hypothetical protein n=1 Tax=Moorena sp. SIO4G3 TaxID=2607821 RepID=UPI00142C1090|nr:hypothetical protein [Moorena sp. SIO4G3]NEO77145.1 hypothetical protein [Moorena sp. SIO4G3]